MTDSNKEQLRKLYDKYNLTTDDIFTNPSQGWTIISRLGIDKIRAASKINVGYDLVFADAEHKTYVVKATASLDGLVIETYGESQPANTRNNYPVAMAQKRAASRAVLQLTGFYDIGVYGQDEAEDFNVKKSERGSITDLIRETLS